MSCCYPTVSISVCGRTFQWRHGEEFCRKRQTCLTEHKNWCSLGRRMQLYYISVLVFFGFQYRSLVLDRASFLVCQKYLTELKTSVGRNEIQMVNFFCSVFVWCSVPCQISFNIVAPFKVSSCIVLSHKNKMQQGTEVALPKSSRMAVTSICGEHWLLLISELSITSEISCSLSIIFIKVK